MKTLIKISWRNVWRNPRRSLVMMFAVAIGLWAGIFVCALSFGLIQQRFQTTIEQHISHVQVHNTEFLKDYNVRYNIAYWEKFRKLLLGDNEVKAFSGRTIVNGMLATATLTRGINLIGIDPVAEANTTGLNRITISGSYFEGEGENLILIGQSLADKTRLREGSRTVITFQNAYGELISALFRVGGIYRSANSSLDERNVFVRQADMDDYIGKANSVNEIAIVGYESEKAAAISNRYRQIFPELSIRQWVEISPELGYTQQLTQTMLLFILVIILFALAFGLINTMLMSVFERTREFGMLMAVGLNQKKVFGMIMLETAFLTIPGAAFGMLAGLLTILLTHNAGIDLAAVGGDSLSDWGFSSLIHPYLEPSFYAILSIMVIITAFLTSVYPAVKALRLKPSEAIRKE